MLCLAVLENNESKHAPFCHIVTGNYVKIIVADDNCIVVMYSYFHIIISGANNNNN